MALEEKTVTRIIKIVIIGCIKKYKKIVDSIRRTHHRRKNILDDTTIIRKNVLLVHSEIGYHSQVNDNSEINGLRMGRYSQIGKNVRIGPRDHIFQNFMIGDECYLHDEFRFDAGLKEFAGYICDIGNDCWICDRSIILPHVKIGNGAIVSAGAIVTKNVPPFAIVGGVPARFIKWRFNEETRRKLTEIGWWNWEIHDVLNNVEMLQELVGFEIDKYKEKYIRPKPDMEAVKDEKKEICN